MKKILSFILVLALTMSLFAACAKKEDTTKQEDTSTQQQEDNNKQDEDKKEDTQKEEAKKDEVAEEVGNILKWNVGADPKTIDPTLNAASDGGDVISQTFEGLTRERSGKVYPGIAESWDVSEDGKTVVFHLRESKWSDGSPLTAHDFVYAWKRGMDPVTASEYSWIWKYTNIVGAKEAVNGASLDDVGVVATDDYTLEVTLKNPTDYIISLLSFYHFMPVKQSAVESKEDGAWAQDPTKVVCNGPFVLTSYRIGEGLTLVRNEHYWNVEKVKLDSIEGKFIDDETTAYQAYLNGELHFIPQVPTTEVPRLVAEDPNFYVYPLLGTYYYNFNLKLDLWNDVKVRRALALAIDREVITETLAAGQVPAAGFVPPGFKDADGKDFFETAGTYGLAADDSKVEEAQALLAEAGYPNGEGFPEFTILYNTNDGHKTVAELIQEMFKTNLGIKCQIQNQEWAVFQDNRIEGNYELARGGWITDFMDPMGLLSLFSSENELNDPKYNSEEFDALLTKANQTRGKQHYDALYKAQEIFINDMPIIPIYHYSDTMLASDQLVDWDRSVLGQVDFSEAYVVE